MGDRQICHKCKRKCSLIHGGKKDASALVTTFHKILFGDYDFSKVLCLPRKITQAIPVLNAGQKHFLEDTNGRRWQVILGIKGGHLAFGKGWDKFFADHGLREGYILAFHYIMKSHFVVHIIDNTGFEKRKFPVANGKSRKRSKIDRNCNAVGECQNLSNNSTKKQGSAFSGTLDSEARKHSQPMSKDKPLSLENGNGIHQHVASADCDIEQFYMINRDAGYKYKEDRSPLLDFFNFEMQLGVDPDVSSDKRTRPYNTSAESNAVAGILNENTVSAKVVSGEPPAEMAASTLSNNNNVTSKRKNVAEVDNDHHGDYPSVLPIEKRAQVHSKSSKRVKFEEAAGSKKHSKIEKSGDDNDEVIRSEIRSKHKNDPCFNRVENDFVDESSLVRHKGKQIMRQSSRKSILLKKKIGEKRITGANKKKSGLSGLKHRREKKVIVTEAQSKDVRGDSSDGGPKKIKKHFE